MSFIHCFDQKSKIYHKIDPNPTEGAHDKEKLLDLEFSTSEFTTICHFEITKQ